jgi:hypothetical protein
MVVEMEMEMEMERGLRMKLISSTVCRRTSLRRESPYFSYSIP